MPVTYEDAYLERFADSAMEARAYTDVDLYGTFSDEWRDRLVVPQAYVTICLENQSKEDDLFAVKLAHYRKELERLLVYAHAATPNSEGLTESVFSIPMERG